MKRGKLIIFVGPSGSGKTTLMKNLLSDKDLQLSFFPTYTTREPRFGELNEKDYFFVSKKEFIDLKNKEFFLETVILNENFYGTSKLVTKSLESGKNIIKILDSDGLINWKRKYPYVLGIFIDVADDKILNRIEKRNDYLNESCIKERISKGNSEREKFSSHIYDEKFINNDFEECYKLIKEFLKNNLSL